MREILFRGKRVDDVGNKLEWVEGGLVYWPEDEIIGTIVNFNSVDEDGCVFGEHIEVALSTVGQYTGLLDKNGEKIFEGDIVRFSYDGDIRSVVFDEEMAEFEFNSRDPVENPDGACLCCDHDGCEIIGNIHDNPELMEEPK